jgi:hypothetical protein
MPSRLTCRVTKLEERLFRYRSDGTWRFLPHSWDLWTRELRTVATAAGALGTTSMRPGERRIKTNNVNVGDGSLPDRKTGWKADI